VNVRRIGITLGTVDGAYGLVCSMAMFAAVAFLMPDMRAGEFISFSAAFGQFLGATMALSGALTGMLAVIPLYERAVPILETVPESADMAQAPGLLSGAIDVSGVSFRYKADGPDVLNDLSISIRAGEFIALVGPSGWASRRCAACCSASNRRTRAPSISTARTLPDSTGWQCGARSASCCRTAS
jgi:ABC-type bacteriocin/lantibiotic exporter with double-glycine peptidase domain